jgi:hypothetical protein
MLCRALLGKSPLVPTAFTNFARDEAFEPLFNPTSTE